MIVRVRAPDMKQMERLIRLFHRRWSVPVLAELHRAKGAKFVSLVNRLGVSRTALKLTLLDLIDAGLAMMNPGYGHPLRPEYILPAESADLARRCALLDDLVHREGVAETAFRKWSMPVLLTLGGGRRHFSQISGQSNVAALDDYWECGSDPRSLSGVCLFLIDSPIGQVVVRYR